ncbi:MAG: DUF6359 domain-containing protein [Bacteroidales bacterium]
MRREISKKRVPDGTLRLWILIGLVLLITSFTVLSVITSCDGLTVIDSDEDTKGELKLNFKTLKTTALNMQTSGMCPESDPVPSFAPGSYPDSNSFILKVKKVGGDYVFNGKYGERPASLKLAAGSYDAKVVSRLFSTPEFDAPCYSDSATVVIEEGKTTTLSFLCRQSNGAVRLGFTSDFKSRFGGYTAEIEDSKGVADYPFSETRFLYLNPGDIAIKLRGPSPSSSTDRLLITRKTLSAREMVTVNLHSSTSGSGGGTGTGGESTVTTGIVIDTSSVWISDDITVGDGRDGLTKESAFTVEDIVSQVGAKGVWVTGYVAGYLTTASLFSTSPFENETNIAIATKRGELTRALCAGVALPSGTIRVALNLKSNPGNLGKRVWIKGTVVESYFGLKGVNSVTDYAIE